MTSSFPVLRQSDGLKTGDVDGVRCPATTRMVDSTRAGVRHREHRSATDDSSRRATIASRGEHDERGAVLILALVFLVAVSLVIMSLAQLAGNNLVATVQFDNALTMKSWANSVANVALQNVRYNFATNTLEASSPVPCWGSSTSASLQDSSSNSSLTMSAWCSTTWNPFSPVTRVVTVSVCLGGITAVECANRPLLEVVAAMNDYPNQFGPANCEPGTAQTSTSTCGTGMTIQSWIFNLTLPTVSVVSPSLSATCSGDLVTVTGSGFSNATDVTIYVDQSPYPSGPYPALSATSISVSNGGGTVTACAPSEPTGTSAFVAVTTPVGTSTYGLANPSSAFTYQ